MQGDSAKVAVAIPAYRDVRCIASAAAALASARAPDRVRVWVQAYVHPRERPGFRRAVAALPRHLADSIHISTRAHLAARGPGPARAQLERTLCDDEWTHCPEAQVWVMHVDAHTQWVRGWDAVLSHAMHQLPRGAVLTGYPQPWLGAAHEFSVSPSRVARAGGTRAVFCGTARVCARAGLCDTVRCATRTVDARDVSGALRCTWRHGARAPSACAPALAGGCCIYAAWQARASALPPGWCAYMFTGEEAAWAARLVARARVPSIWHAPAELVRHAYKHVQGTPTAPSVWRDLAWAGLAWRAAQAHSTAHTLARERVVVCEEPAGEVPARAARLSITPT